MTIVRSAFLDALPRLADLDAPSRLLEFKQPHDRGAPGSARD